jgi:hypothetical protein
MKDVTLPHMVAVLMELLQHLDPTLLDVWKRGHTRKLALILPLAVAQME